MKARFVFALAAVAACAPQPPPRPAVVPPPPAAQQTVSPNALTQIASVPKSIAEPKIRVGMLSDQTSVTFPRIDGGYYIIADNAASTLRRGFTDTAPLTETAAHYAVQASALSDKPSADAYADRLRTQTGQRVDVIFEPAAGLYRVLVGDFPSSQAAT